ncbi:hypothetical protein DY000_02057230 [Brassica cretica]|uniref:Uncharacterized protein n=1 Tax=Brassica cretica TaxID=69181 RepID=A0ABQ7ACB6_BRACR|nr:hypothetical protein DY000_02057230 [Brassica cretica]
MILFPKHILSDFSSNRFRDSQTLVSPFLYNLCSSPRYKAPKLLSSSFDDCIKSYFEFIPRRPTRRRLLVLMVHKKETESNLSYEQEP